MPEGKSFLGDNKAYNDKPISRRNIYYNFEKNKLPTV